MKTRFVYVFFLVTLIAGCNDKQQATVVESKEKKSVRDSIHTGTAVYKWWHDACNYEGTYLVEKYTARQLEGTYYLWHTTGYLTNASPSFPRALYEFNLEKELAKLDEEYVQKRVNLERLELVPGAKWEDLRQSRLRELKEIYDFVRVSLEGIASPETFLNNPFHEYCSEYAEALNAGDADVLEAWRKLIEKRAKSYGYESIERSYMNRYNYNRKSPDSVAHARIDIFHYGWYECADSHVYHVDEKGLKEDFEKLFSNVEKDCPPDNETDGI
jgi:hypothetical protein